MNKSDREVLRAAFRRPIAFHPAFADIAGSAAGGIFLSQLWYWSERTNDPNGWIYKTYEEWHKETRLSRSEIDRARRSLRSSGVLEEKKQGVPCRLFYRLNEDAIIESLRILQTETQNPASQFAESGKPVCRILQTETQNPANDLYMQRVQTETTPESGDTRAGKNSLPDIWEPEAGAVQTDPPEDGSDQDFSVSNKSSGDGEKAAPPRVELLANNPDDHFLNGSRNRREYRNAIGQRHAINPEVFPTVEAQDEFWAAAAARIMVENPRQHLGTAKAIASGYVKQLNTGENVNSEARQLYALWKSGGIASAPHVTTAKAAKRQNLYTDFLGA